MYDGPDWVRALAQGVLAGNSASVGEPPIAPVHEQEEQKHGCRPGMPAQTAGIPPDLESNHPDLQSVSLEGKF